MFDRKMSWLLACGLALLLTPAAAAQEIEFQPFAPADLSPYGSGPPPNEGFFFTFDLLHWSISAPSQTTIGAPGLTRTVWDGGFLREETNSLTTGELSADFTSGQRFEVGFVRDRGGWLFGAFNLTSQTQRINRSHASVVFEDPPFGPLGLERLMGFIDIDGDGFDDDINFNSIFGRDGIDTDVPPDGEPDQPFATDFGDIVRLPVRFDDLQIRNRTQFHGVELMHVHRFPQTRKGAVWEMYFGARYLEFHDRFQVWGFGREPLEDDDDEVIGLPTTILADSRWNTSSRNNIVGPQIGVHWHQRTGRFLWNIDARYMAGANFQGITQGGTIGSELEPGPANAPLSFGRTTFNHSVHEREFSNIVDLRLNMAYQLTRAVSLRVGWTGMYMDGIARASNMIRYQLPDMGIRTDQNRQDVFVHGVNFGVEVNR